MDRQPHNLVSMQPVPRFTLACTCALLVLRMARAGVVMAYRCWRLSPRIGDKFHAQYKCKLDFTDCDLKLPRVVEPTDDPE